GKFFENTPDDQPSYRQGAVHRPADARCEAIIPHSFFTETDRGRMDDDGHIKLRCQLEEWHCVVIVGVVPLQTRGDPRAFEAVLLHRAFEFAQKAVAAKYDSRCKSVDEIVLFLLGCDV